MRVNGLKQEDLKSGTVKIFGLSLLFSIVMSYNLAAFLATPDTTIWWGAAAGALAGIGWVALSIGVLALFERRSLTYVLINGGYFALSFVVMGVILGSWR